MWSSSRLFGSAISNPFIPASELNSLEAVSGNKNIEPLSVDNADTSTSLFIPSFNSSELTFMPKECDKENVSSLIPPSEAVKTGETLPPLIYPVAPEALRKEYVTPLMSVVEALNMWEVTWEGLTALEPVFSSAVSRKGEEIDVSSEQGERATSTKTDEIRAQSPGSDPVSAPTKKRQRSETSDTEIAEATLSLPLRKSRRLERKAPLDLQAVA